MNPVQQKLVLITDFTCLIICSTFLCVIYICILILTDEHIQNSQFVFEMQNKRFRHCCPLQCTSINLNRRTH